MGEVYVWSEMDAGNWEAPRGKGKFDIETGWAQKVVERYAPTYLSSPLSSDSEDDDWERKAIEKEDEEVRDFVKCHPMPSPNDDEGETFWKKVIDRMKAAGEVNGMIIYSFVRFDIMKKMYENLAD